jgi:protoporphyrinogen IX oxidase
MLYLTLKSLHLIFIVTWFSGLFYLVRLFIYHTEAIDNLSLAPNEQLIVDRLTLMERRLWYGITCPSCFLTLILGLWLLYENHIYFKQVWMHLKLLMVFLLLLYHLICGHLRKVLAKGETTLSSLQLRYWNEVATIFLVGIVFLVVFKNSVAPFWALGGLGVFAIILISIVRFYKKIRGN